MLMPAVARHGKGGSKRKSESVIQCMLVAWTTERCVGFQCRLITRGRGVTNAYWFPRANFFLLKTGMACEYLHCIAQLA